MTTFPVHNTARVRMLDRDQNEGPRSPAASPLRLKSPGRYTWLKQPLRFVRARLRMVGGPALSVRWGLDRGLPAHRHYINLFLEEFRSDLRGACLEFDASDYLDMFGSEEIDTQDVLHLDDANPRATIIGDITQPTDLPSDRFDCIICTHVLHVIDDVHAAVRGLHRILRPGGRLLCAVPHVSMCDEREGERWRFTRLGIERLLSDVFGKNNVEARGYGNSMVAAGEMRGLIANEFTWRELHRHDPRSAVEICARAVKRG